MGLVQAIDFWSWVCLPEFISLIARAARLFLASLFLISRKQGKLWSYFNGREFPMSNIDFREVAPSSIGTSSHLQKPIGD